MSTIEHPFFGTLGPLPEVDDVIWEQDIDLGDGKTCDACLWASNRYALEPAALDAYARLLQDLPTLDATARRALCAYLHEDRFYIEDFVENVEESDVLAQLGDDPARVCPEVFVAQMQLHHIGLWPHTEYDTPVVLDYMIDAEASDQILAVKMDLAGQVLDVVWES